MAFKHYKQISKQDIPSMKVENVEAYLRDFSISDDKEKPITSGLFKLFFFRPTFLQTHKQ